MSESLFNPLEHPVCFEFPLCLDETAWAGHVPFAMFLVSALRPRKLVELGAYSGVSYCAFCQAVKSLHTETKCFAIDTWQGDEHVGEIEEEVLQKLKAHHDPLYNDFSRLVQSTFDDAVEHFTDSSIDLLHIDGFHSYEAVRHDFDTWKPKVSPRGIVLFHDTNVRERGFGVWKLWEEVKREFPHFEFLHSHGLGVLQVGHDSPKDLRSLFSADENQSVAVRRFFHALGEYIELCKQFRDQSEDLRELQKYASVIKNSRLLQAYRVWKDQGAGGVLRKAVKYQ